MNDYVSGLLNAQPGIQAEVLKAHFSFINCLLSASQQDPLFFTGQISAQERWQEKKSAVEFCSHDATLPVTTSAPVFHLWLLLVWSCHVRRRIRASFPPLSPPFLPVPGVGRVAAPHKGESTGSVEGSAIQQKTVWELRSLIFHFQGLPHRLR